MGQSDDDASGNGSPAGKPMERKVLSSLNLVDLAGSERVSKTGATGTRLAEGANINKSLSCLTTVIQKLSEPRKPGQPWHIPFRDSKLTHLLKTAIGGNSFTTVFCCMTLSSLQVDESRSTLQFAQRAKKIRNEVQMNEVADPKTRVRTLELEVKRLRRMLVANDIYLFAKRLRIRFLEEQQGGVGARSSLAANEELTQSLVQENATLRAELQDALTAIAAMGGTVSGGTLQGGGSMHVDPAGAMSPVGGGGGGKELEELRAKAGLLESDLIEAESIKAALQQQVSELEEMLDEMETDFTTRDKAKDEQLQQLRDQVRAYELDKATAAAEVASLRSGMQQMQAQREEEQAAMLSSASGDELRQQLTQLQVKFSQLQFENATLFDMYSRGEQERLAKETALQELLQDAETRCIAVKADLGALQGHVWKFVNLATSIVGGQQQSNTDQHPRQQQVDHALRVLSDMATRRTSSAVSGAALAGAAAASSGSGGEPQSAMMTASASGNLAKEASGAAGAGDDFSIGRNFRRGADDASTSTNPETLQRKIRELENIILQKDNHRDIIIDTKLKRMQELVLRLHTANSTLQLEVDRVVAENKRLHELVARDGRLSAIVKSDGLQPASADLIRTTAQFAATPSLPYYHN